MQRETHCLWLTVKGEGSFHFVPRAADTASAQRPERRGRDVGTQAWRPPLHGLHDPRAPDPPTCHASPRGRRLCLGGYVTPAPPGPPTYRASPGGCRLHLGLQRRLTVREQACTLPARQHRPEIPFSPNKVEFCPPDARVNKMSYSVLVPLCAPLMICGSRKITLLKHIAAVTRPPFASASHT